MTGNLVDPEQAPLVVAAFLSTWVAISFTAVVSLRHNDAHNRLWAAGFCAFATAAWSTALAPLEDPGVESAIAVAGLALLPLCLAWGAAQLRERPAWLELGALPLIGAVALWAGVTAAGGTAAWTVALVLIAALCLLAAVRFLDGPLRHNLNARILVGVSALSALGIGVERIESSDPDLAYDVTTVVLAALLLVAAPCLTALRVEQSANWWATRDETDRLDLLGLLSSTAFQHDAEERLRRAERTGVASYLTRMQVDGLAEINTAFGRDAGDAALAFAARVLARHAPPSALIGHLGAGDFVVHSLEDGNLIESAVRSGLLRDELPALLPTRFDVTTAVATARPGSTLADLLGSTGATAAAYISPDEAPLPGSTPLSEFRAPTPTDAD